MQNGLLPGMRMVVKAMEIGSEVMGQLDGLERIGLRAAQGRLMGGVDVGCGFNCSAVG